MSGHNKWSKIKHKKTATDAKKSREFSKLVRLISLESKQAGEDIQSPALKMAIEKAKQANMPKDVIERAIVKGAGKDQGTMDHVTYEAYGPGGAAIIILGITDNRNRTGAEIKHILSSHGMQLAEPGAALWAFEKEPSGYTPKTKTPLLSGDKEELYSLVDDLREHDDVQEVYTNAQ